MQHTKSPFHDRSGVRHCTARFVLLLAFTELLYHKAGLLNAKSMLLKLFSDLLWLFIKM